MSQVKEKAFFSAYTERLKGKVVEWGAGLVGVADLEPFREIRTYPPDLLESFCRALAIAVQLPVSVFETISDGPTPIYLSVYQTANRILDGIAFRAAVTLQGDGFRSLPIPASQIVNPEDWYGAISHKAVARMAGLGWQGKNLLLVTPQYGPRVRLVTVLTTAPLDYDEPIRNRCGKCTLCRDACPVGAIKGKNTEGHYKDRNEALHFSKCAEKLTKEFAGMPEIGVPICGICIKVCPYGLKVEPRSSVRKKNMKNRRSA